MLNYRRAIDVPNDLKTAMCLLKKHDGNALPSVRKRAGMNTFDLAVATMGALFFNSEQSNVLLLTPGK